jgi:hypothetical protein
MRCVCCSLWAGPPIVHELERAVETHLLGPLEDLLFFLNYVSTDHQIRTIPSRQQLRRKKL